MLRDPDDVDALSTEVRFVAVQMTRRLRAEATAGGLTASQEGVVAHLTDSDGLTAAELARAEHVRPQAMTPTIAALEAAGYITRSVDDADARRNVLTVTSSGRAALTEARAMKQEWLSSLLSVEFTRQERQELQRGLELLRRVAAAPHVVSQPAVRSAS